VVSVKWLLPMAVVNPDDPVPLAAPQAPGPYVTGNAALHTARVASVPRAF